MKNFIFHPPYGYKTDPETKKRAGATGFAEGLVLDLDDKTPLPVKPGEALLEVVVLNRDNKVVKRSLMVRASDIQTLTDIENGLAWAAFGSSMQNIEAGIEAYVNLLGDLAELIPGVGPVIEGARLAAVIAEFFESGAYKDMRGFLSGELTNIVEGLGQKLKDALDPENLIQLVIFGDARLDELLARSTLGKGGPSKTPSDSGKGKFSALRSIVKAFKRLGHAVFSALRTLNHYVELPIDDFRAFTSTRPLLAFVLVFIADHIYTIFTLAEQAALLAARAREDRPAGAPDDIASRAKEQQEGTGTQLHEILRKLEELKLPETIINIAPAVQKILDEFLLLVGRRMGIKGKVVAIILKDSGALDLITERIAREIVAAGVDPNVYWRDRVVPSIAAQFNETRKTVIDQINSLLGKGLGGAFQPVPPSAPLKLTTEKGEHFAETEPTKEELEGQGEPEEEADAEPSSSPGQPMTLRPAEVPTLGAGSSLNAALRKKMELAFGHDFGHVRLHSGSAARGMTDVFGVRGLATGSHIFLRPGLSATSGEGFEVLGHELAHVLQQAGPRPLGRPYANVPAAGHPERGLHYDPTRENVADRVADIVRKHVSGKPLGTGPGAPLGMQPSGLNLFTVSRTLRAFTNVPALKERQEKLEQIKTEAKLPKDAKTAVENLCKVLENLNGNPGIVKSRDVFKEAIPSIHNRLHNSLYAEPIRLAAFEIARESLQPWPKTKGGKGESESAAPKVDEPIGPFHLARELEGFILGKTGIALALKLNTRDAEGPGGKKLKTVKEDNPLAEIKILHIHLPYIAGQSPLWSMAINNTWKDKDDKYKAKARANLRTILDEWGIVTGVWALFGKEYMFSIFIKNEVDKLIKADTSLDPADLPSWGDYASPDGSEKIGVRISTYGDANQTGRGRESHHLTQYLLADYFTNSNESKKPFLKDRDYPGVEKSAGKVSTLSKTPGGLGEKIRVLDTKGKGDNDRGPDMPAISLARATHRGGRLHISPEPDDIEGATNHKAQSYALHNRFAGEIPALLASDKEYQAFVAAKKPDGVADAIFNAAQHTYKFVEDYMSRQLKANMPRLEVDYYRGIAEGTTKDLRDAANPDTPTKREHDFLAKLSSVADEAKKRNTKGMADFGWKLD